MLLFLLPMSFNRYELSRNRADGSNSINRSSPRCPRDLIQQQLLNFDLTLKKEFIRNCLDIYIGSATSIIY